MASKRADDPVERTWFRTDRILKDCESYFFLTREGTMEGPFDCQLDAIRRLEAYIKVIQTGLSEIQYELSARA